MTRLRELLLQPFLTESVFEGGCLENGFLSSKTLLQVRALSLQPTAPFENDNSTHLWLRSCKLLTHPKNAGCGWLMHRGLLLFFCLPPLSLLFPKDTSPVTVLVYPRQRRKIKQLLLANSLRRWAPPPRASPVASSSLTSLCEELEKRRAPATTEGSERVLEASGRGRSRSPARRQPSPGGGKAASRAHRPAPSAPLPAAGTLHILPGSARRGPNA